MSRLYLSIDGQEANELGVDLFEFPFSELFEGEITEEGIDHVAGNEPVGAWPNCYTTGYLLILRPLPPGSHTLQYGFEMNEGPLRWRCLTSVSLDVQ